MESGAIIDVLSRTVPASGLEAVQAADGMPTIYVALDQLVQTCRALRELRWTGFVQMVLFFLILLAGYVYVWRKGVFDWGHER